MNGLHRQLERDHLGATFPFLQVRYDPVSDEADLRYLSSRRGFGRFVVGPSPDFENHPKDQIRLLRAKIV